jgi:hypothetical protein
MLIRKHLTGRAAGLRRATKICPIPSLGPNHVIISDHQGRALHLHTYDVSYINPDSAMTSSSRGHKLPISSVPLELTIRLQAKDRNPVLPSKRVRARKRKGARNRAVYWALPPLSLISILPHTSSLIRYRIPQATYSTCQHELLSPALPWYHSLQAPEPQARAGTQAPPAAERRPCP